MPAPEIRPKTQNLAAPSAMEQELAGEYDPEKFWGYDLMFQFPWETVEHLFQSRLFRKEKPEKTEKEMVSVRDAVW